MNQPGGNNGSAGKWLPLAVCLQIVSRIPFIFLGYGADDDAWRVARSAQEFFRSGHYTASRLPGYPLFETVNALLIPAGKWYLSNTATLAVSVITLLVFDRIIRQQKLKARNYLLVLFVFFPLLWTNSANTMDYSWALLFILASFYFLLRERFFLAAALLGIAAGFRLSSAAFILPWTINLLVSGNRRRLPLFILVAALFGLAAFSLPLLRYGTGVFSFYRPHVHELSHIPYYLAYTMGIPASLALLFGIIRYGGRLWKDLLAGHPFTITCAAAVLTITVLFCLIPQDRVYLLPLFPFLFFLLGRFFSKRLLTIFIIFSLVYALVRIEVKDNASPDVVRVKPHLSDGLVTGSFKHRRAQLRLRNRLAPSLLGKFGAENKALFISGYIIGLPQLVDNQSFERKFIPGVRADLYRLKGSEILVLSGTVNREIYEYFKERDYRLLFLAGSIRYARNSFGFVIDPAQEEIITAGDMEKSAR